VEKVIRQYKNTIIKIKFDKIRNTFIQRMNYKLVWNWIIKTDSKTP